MTLKLRTWFWRVLPGLHPEIGDLVLWVHHPELPQPRGLAAHVARCPQCEQEVRRLRSAHAIQGENNVECGTALSEVFESLQHGMRAWSALRESVPSAPSPVCFRPGHRRMTQALELYFGKEAAHCIQVSARWDAPDDGLLPASKLLFDTFLGRRAAAALARQIVRSAS